MFHHPCTTCSFDGAVHHHEQSNNNLENLEQIVIEKMQNVTIENNGKQSECQESNILGNSESMFSEDELNIESQNPVEINQNAFNQRTSQFNQEFQNIGEFGLNIKAPITLQNEFINGNFDATIRGQIFPKIGGPTDVKGDFSVNIGLKYLREQCEINGQIIGKFEATCSEANSEKRSIFDQSLVHVDFQAEYYIELGIADSQFARLFSSSIDCHFTGENGIHLGAEIGDLIGAQIGVPFGAQIGSQIQDQIEPEIRDIEVVDEFNGVNEFDLDDFLGTKEWNHDDLFEIDSFE